ncbi:hypothetical protein ACFV7Q_36615 [Streptomyces sp. NPDC059851]|uniref:hypothetical protein n=1 Tax=Streptomyces sp. NPDC059851 TaxID=3346971 RepID=UPI0036610B48
MSRTCAFRLRSALVALAAAAALVGGTAVAEATSASHAASGPVLVGFYGTLEECFDAGSQVIGEHGCVFVGARGYALYVYE